MNAEISEEQVPFCNFINLKKENARLTEYKFLWNTKSEHSDSRVFKRKLCVWSFELKSWKKIGG